MVCLSPVRDDFNRVRGKTVRDKIYAMCFTESYETINHYHLREAVNSEHGHRTSAALVDCKNQIYRKTPGEVNQANTCS